MEDYDNRFACYDILEEYPQDESERHIFMGMGHRNLCSCQAYSPFGNLPNICGRTSCQHSINDHRA